jgi:hypothetical protein
MRRELRVLIAAIVLSTLATSTAIAGDDSSRPPREDRVPYSIGEGNVFGIDTERGVFVSSATILVGRERFLDLAVADSLGTQVAGSIVGESGLIANFCGATQAPVRVRPYEVVEVWLVSGVCDNATPSIPTQGELIATLYKRRP